MKKIFKFQIGAGEVQWLTVPQGTQLLTVRLQNGFPYLWALLDDSEAVYVRCEIYTVETGVEMDDRWDATKYLGSVLILNDTKVFHFFGEVLNAEEIEAVSSTDLARWTE